MSFPQVLGPAIGIAASIASLGASTLIGSFLWAVGGGFTAGFVATGSLKAGIWGALSAALFWGFGNQFSNIAAEAALASASEAYESFMNTGLTGGQFAAQVAAHSAAGGTLNVLQGGKFGHGFISAGVTKALTPAIDSAAEGNIFAGTVASAVVGGTASELSGGNFANGARTAAFQFLFNQAATRSIQNCLSNTQQVVSARSEMVNPLLASEFRVLLVQVRRYDPSFRHDVVGGPPGPRDFQLVREALRVISREQQCLIGGVYLLRDRDTFIVTRTGRSMNLEQRELNHRNSPLTGNLSFQVYQRTNSYLQQRGFEEQAFLSSPRAPLDFIRPISHINPNGIVYRHSVRGLD